MSQSHRHCVPTIGETLYSCDPWEQQKSAGKGNKELRRKGGRDIFTSRWEEIRPHYSQRRRETWERASWLRWSRPTGSYCSRDGILCYRTGDRKLLCCPETKLLLFIQLYDDFWLCPVFWVYLWYTLLYFALFSFHTLLSCVTEVLKL